jgi:hypothetical protein
LTSIYQRALGSDFGKLHPRIQERFGLTSGGGRAAIGRGVMDEVWRGAFFTLPFLCVGTWRNIMFPEHGRNVPFEIENWAYLDSLGRETVTWLRTFHTDRTRRFDAYMIYSERRGCIVDYLGTHQHLAVDLELSVDPRGGLRLRSGEQRFYEHKLAFRFPPTFSGTADVCEWFDEAAGRYRIQVEVTNRRWGRLFGYRGGFDVEWRDATHGPPASARPRREEARE